jgi:hypothetical protein
MIRFHIASAWRAKRRKNVPLEDRLIEAIETCANSHIIGGSSMRRGRYAKSYTK